MVKILQAHNFARQNTYSLNGEILAATLIDENRLAITTAEQFIEIYEIDVENDEQSKRKENDAYLNAKPKSNEDSQRIPKRYAFPTVGEVVNLIYCKSGKYLITLEKENLDSPTHSNSTNISCTSNSNTIANDIEEEKKMFVRIYANFWQFPEHKLADLAITIRIASMTTPKAPLLESIDVIELPLRSFPHLIQCCQISGNIIVSCKDRINLYEYTECVHENTQPRFSFIDFLPFKFFVSLNFIPLKLCLAENVIACMNNRYCVAFKIVDVIASSTGVGDDVFDNVYDNHIVDEDIDESQGDASIASKASAAVSQHSNNSYKTDSLSTTPNGRLLGGTVGFSNSGPVDFNVARMLNSAYGREFAVDLKSQWDENDSSTGNACSSTADAQEIFIYPTRANDIKIKLVNEAKAMKVQRICSEDYVGAHCNDKMVQYDIRKLLQINMQSSEPNGRIVDILKCMDLKGIYQRNNQINKNMKTNEIYVMGNQQVPSAVTTLKHSNYRTLKSNMYTNCIGFALLVTSSVDGYLYQFCAQGKWYNENEKPIATYSFTAPILHVHINDFVIYATTIESVETHTSRIGHKLFNNRFEYPMVNGLFPEESSPDINSPIAVIGLCSFINVHFVCVNHNNLVLITNSLMSLADSTATNSTVNKKRSTMETKKNIAARILAEAKAKHNLLRSGNANQNSPANDWTLYVLNVPPVENIVEDLEAIAEANRSASDSNFYDLMEEAHVMLRLSLLLNFDNISPEREQKLRLKFLDNCRKLADFSIRSNKKDVYLQATGFYKMCDMNLLDIYTNYVKSVRDLGESLDKSKLDSDRLVGFVHTIKVNLLNIGKDRQKCACLNNFVEPFFTERNLIKNTSQVPLSLEFLNMFIKYAPVNITEIMIRCPLIADTISTELINYLKQLEAPTAEETLLLGVTACRQSNFLLSKEVVEKMSRRDLATALIKHKNVLFDDSTILCQKHGSEAYKATTTKSRRSVPANQQKQNVATSDNQQTKEVLSFSDFTEIILLATDKIELIEAISDAFIHALCMDYVLSLDATLQLFLNFFASHIGQKGYQTSQIVLVNVLQVYYYDMFDVTFMRNVKFESTSSPGINDEIDDVPSLSSEYEKENHTIYLDDSTSSSTPEICYANKSNRIVYDELSEQNSPSKNNSEASFVNIELDGNNNSKREIDLKGLKILFRMYLGRLKALCDQHNVENEPSNGDVQHMRSEYISFMLRYLQKLRSQQQHDHSACGKKSECYYLEPNKTYPSGDLDGNNERIFFVPYIPNYKLNDLEYKRHIENYVRPIPCLLERPQYLNRLPPFTRSDFSTLNVDQGEYEIHFLKWDNELLVLALKIQSILAYQKICREIIEEFIAFIHKSPNLSGIDSFLLIILPRSVAINFMLNFYPQCLWSYGKSCGFTTKHWQSLFQKILNKRDEVENWKVHISDILDNLVAELTFEDLLQCFPLEITKNRTNISFDKEFYELLKTEDGKKPFYMCVDEEEEPKQPLERNHIPMDNIDESNVFEVALRKAVAKQRSIALRAMIESTGSQLLDATSSSMYNL